MRLFGLENRTFRTLESKILICQIHARPILIYCSNMRLWETRDRECSTDIYRNTFELLFIAKPFLLFLFILPRMLTYTFHLNFNTRLTFAHANNHASSSIGEIYQHIYRFWSKYCSRQYLILKMSELIF